MIESDDGSGNDEEWPSLGVQHTVGCSPITSSRGATNDHTSSHKWCDDIFCTQLHSVGYNAMELTLLRTSANRRHHIWGVSGELGWCTGWCWWYTAGWYIVSSPLDDLCINIWISVMIIYLSISEPRWQRDRVQQCTSQMLTIADKGGWGSEKFQQRVFMGTKNVDREDNWFRFNHTC